jgi:hypothetical protein
MTTAFFVEIAAAVASKPMMAPVTTTWAVPSPKIKRRMTRRRSIVSSSPMVNSRKMTPSSASAPVTASLLTGPHTWGPTYQAGRQIAQYQARSNSLKNRNDNDGRDQKHQNIGKKRMVFYQYRPAEAPGVVRWRTRPRTHAGAKPRQSDN